MTSLNQIEIEDLELTPEDQELDIITDKTNINQNSLDPEDNSVFQEKKKISIDEELKAIDHYGFDESSDSFDTFPNGPKEDKINIGSDNIKSMEALNQYDEVSTIETDKTEQTCVVDDSIHKTNDGPPNTGKTYCYWWSKETGRPRIVFGPDWPFT